MDTKSGNGIAANYFLANSAKSTKYDDTLPDLGLEDGEVIPYFKHSKEKEIVYDKMAEKLFPKVFDLLTQSYNIVLYGLGSKRQFIDEFRMKLLEQFTVIEFYGYKDVGMRQILSSFQEALDCDKQEEDYIIQRVQKLKRPVFLIIHSLDRLCARNCRIKSLINRILTASSKVHFLTSVDHINSPLQWTYREVDVLNLIWIHCTPLGSYKIEKSFAHLSTSRSLGSVNHRSAAATLMAVSNVYGNLPSNSQNIFLLILNFFQSHYSNDGNADQRSKSNGRRKVSKNNDTDSDTDDDEETDDRTEFATSKSGKGFEGYPFSQLYLDCMDAFYVNSEPTLRAQLVEFVDHKFIRSRTGTDGSEFIELLIQPKLIPKLIQELSH